MDKKLILAVAGSGKTYEICNQLDENKRNLILAYTNENINNIYKELLKIDNINLSFDEEALKEISKYAETENESSENIGARRLFTIMELILEDISFNASGEHPMLDVKIDKEYVTKALKKIVKEHDLRKYVL